MQTVLITGAEGFTGSRLLTQLEAQGCDVVAAVRNRARKLAYERQDRRALVCDVTDAINVARVVASVRPGAVVHLAGTANPAEATAQPHEAFQSIVMSCANVLDAVRRTVPRAKVILASAADVYGNVGAGGEPLAEAVTASPISTFGSWKLMAEMVAHTFFRDYHLNVTIARPFAYIGAGQPRWSFLGALLDRLTCTYSTAPGGEIEVPELGYRRDLLHVDDVVAAYLVLLEHGQPDETYNICSGCTTRYQEVGEMVAAALGKHLTLVERPAANGRTRIMTLCGDNRKLTELGWGPRRSIAEAVQEFVAAAESAKPAVTRA